MKGYVLWHGSTIEIKDSHKKIMKPLAFTKPHDFEENLGPKPWYHGSSNINCIKIHYLYFSD